MALAMQGASYPVQLSFPNLVQDTPGNFGEYSGNYLARELRDICNNTKGLFPKSAKRDPNYYAKNGKPIRYQSSYEADINGRFWDNPKFQPISKIKEEPEMWPVIGEHPAPVKKERKKLKYKMFMNWKIPERVVSNDGSRASTRESHESRKSVASKQSVKSAPLPKIPDMAPSPTKSMTPAKSAKPSTRLPRKSPSEAIRHSLDPQLHQKAKELLESAAPCERRAIEKAVFAAERAGKQGPNEPKRTYKTDSMQAVNSWMADATDDERALALNFFSTMSARKMMGDSAEKRKHFNQVISQLETGRGGAVSQSVPCHPMAGGDRRGQRKLQLYPPGERRNRWQHTSWHHMPDYRDMDPVNNKTSIYIDSQKVIPRHYTIHPDWGM